MHSLRTFEGPVVKVEPSNLHSGMDLVQINELGRTINDDNLVSVLVPTGSILVGTTVSVRVEDGETSLIDR